MWGAHQYAHSTLVHGLQVHRAATRTTAFGQRADLFAVLYIDSFHLSYPCLQDVLRPQLELFKVFAKICINVMVREMQ